MSDEHNPFNPEHTATYQAGSPIRCEVCTALAKAQRAHTKALGDDNADDVSGLYWEAQLVPRGLRRAD